MEEESARAEIIGSGFIIDATSILGLVNLGLDKAYNLVLYESEAKQEKVIKRIRDYIVA